MSNKNKKLLFGLFILLIVGLPLLAFRYPDLIKIFPKKDTSVLETKLACPSIPSFCAQTKHIKDNNLYLGFGGNLDSDSPIFAAFDGTLTQVLTHLPPSLNNEELNTIILDPEDQTQRAVYLFKGDTAVSGIKVKKGDLIGKTTGHIMAYQTSLVFQLLKDNQRLVLTSDSFEK